ncbi:hypothetical protein AVEN_120814-1 [Araneus ventricosus]|uniref:Transposase Tc1-like domain-containing protein n=1 Tax=Araneus ventricosus TaxID=182803 RepID=A0A4Y2FAC5_ARAVE|nr:hypothetical protein AVEN_120814-1 [Araneus ventricosus]
MGYGSRRSTGVPLLTTRHRLQRLCWARERISWTLDDWRNVAWLEESRFHLLRADGRVRAWRRRHEVKDTKFSTRNCASCGVFLHDMD